MIHFPLVAFVEALNLVCVTLATHVVVIVLQTLCGPHQSSHSLLLWKLSGVICSGCCIEAFV